MNEYRDFVDGAFREAVGKAVRYWLERVDGRRWLTQSSAVSSVQAPSPRTSSCSVVLSDSKGSVPSECPGSRPFGEHGVLTGSALTSL